jgi:hypothetical protein
MIAVLIARLARMRSGVSRNRRALSIDLGEDVEAGLSLLAAAVVQSLSRA